MAAFVQRRMFFVLYAAFLFWSGATTLHCTPSTPTGSATIGAAGGKLTSPDGKLTLEIPAGALSSDTVITLSKSPSLPEQANRLSLAYTLQPDGLAFAKPATVQLKLAASDLPSDSLQSNRPLLFLYTKSNETFELLQDLSTQANPEATEILVSGNIAHFSELRITIVNSAFVLQTAQDITLPVGQFHAIEAAAVQAAVYGKGTKQTIKVIEFSIDNRSDTLRFFGPPKRGANFLDPFHNRFGNSYDFATRSFGGFFPANPPILLECTKVGNASFFVDLLVTLTLTKDGETPVGPEEGEFKVALRSALNNFSGGTRGYHRFRINVTCVALSTPPAEPAEPTANDIQHIQRRANGDIAAIGKNAVTIHDPQTTKRKNTVHLGNGIIDEVDVFDDPDESVALEQDHEKPDTPQGTLRSEGKTGTKPLILPKDFENKRFSDIKSICPADTQKPCSSNAISVVDQDGKLFVLQIDASTKNASAIPILLPQIDQIETAALVQIPQGYEGIAIATPSGAIHVFTHNTSTQTTTSQSIGESKPGKHLLRCDRVIQQCVVGNLTTNELTYLLKDSTDQRWKLTHQDTLAPFTGIDLLKHKQGATLLVTHAAQNTLTRTSFSDLGKPLLSENIQSICTRIVSAVLVDDGNDYIAACKEKEGHFLLRRPFAAPPQEPNPEPQDKDGGTTETIPEPTLETTPDPQVDCSKYRYTETGKTYPAWYAGEITSPVCRAMYDKLYGQNGKDTRCTTDADCQNPCRYLCCGFALRLEMIVCKSGQCSLEITNKCDFCADPQISPATCGLPPGYNP